MQATSERQDEPPSRQQLAARERSAPGKVTGRLKRAMDAMVWQGLKRAEAAAAANMSEHSLYVALRRPHVRAHYLSELEVLRTSERARNIHTLAEVRDQTSNQMARVQAVKALEQIEEAPTGAAGRQSVAGLVLILGSGSVADMGHIREIEAKPLIQQKVVPHEE